MTIETKTNRVQYVGNGVTTEFPVPFPVLQPDHLRLFLWQNNRQTEMTVDFTVIVAGTASVSVRTADPVPVGAKLTILREVPLKQEMDLLNGGDFNAEILEGSADNLEMQIQQLAEKVGRAIVAPESMDSSEVTYETLIALKEEAADAADEAMSARDEAVSAEASVAANTVIVLAATATAVAARDAAAQSASIATSSASSASADALRAETAAAGVQDAVDDATGLYKSLGWLPWKQAINSCRFTRSAIEQAMKIHKLQNA